MKTCTKCLKNKDLHEFSKQRGKLKASCKACAVEEVQARQKTMSGLIKKIYHNQKMTTKKMGRTPPTYTEQELFNWAVGQGLIPLWEAWVASEHDKWLSPSIDRLNNKQSYTLGNIRLVTWKENLDKQKQDNIDGVYLHTGSKAVDQLTLEGEYLKTFPSVAIAAREVNGARVGVSNITAVCSGKWHSAYGYKWRFAPTNPLS